MSAEAFSPLVVRAGDLRVSDYSYRVGLGYTHDTVPDELWEYWYEEKKALLEEWFGGDVSWKDFYSYLFPLGTLQPYNPFVDENGVPHKKNDKENTYRRKMRWVDARSEGKGNLVVVREDLYTTKDGQEKKKRRPYLIYDGQYDDLEYSLKATEKCLVSPVSYFGRKMTMDASHEVFAIVVDIDFVVPEHLENLIQLQHMGRIQKLPSFIVSSGRGLHLYFLLNEPVHLYNYAKEALTTLKNGLADSFWNEATSLRPFKVDHGSIVQEFRAVGSRSKLGEDFPVRAYQCHPELKRFSLDELKDMCLRETREKLDIASIYSCVDTKRYHTTPLDQAKDLWPEWYASMIEKHGKEENFPTPLPKTTRYKYHFVMPRKVYDRAVKDAEDHVFVGGRYNTLRTICALGIKCSDYDEKRNPHPVTDEEIRRDVWRLFPIYQAMSKGKSDRFTRSDVEDALTVLDEENRELGRRTKRSWVEGKTALRFPPAIPRNGKKREWHLEDIRADKVKMKKRGIPFKHPEGRPSKQKVVADWQRKHPNGTKADCIRDTGLTKPTVYKWWQSP